MVPRSSSGELQEMLALVETPVLKILREKKSHLKDMKFGIVRAFLLFRAKSSQKQKAMRNGALAVLSSCCCMHASAYELLSN